jgi:hypothetical protein
MGDVVLGRPGEFIAPGARVDVRATRVGGAPTWPAGCGAPPAALTVCRACGAQLALVLSVSGSHGGGGSLGVGRRLALRSEPRRRFNCR